MSCEDCVGTKNCKTYQSLKQAVKKGRSEMDFMEDSVSCRRGWGCEQNIVYEIPYRGE